MICKNYKKTISLYLKSITSMYANMNFYKLKADIKFKSIGQYFKL